jgi:hypothetical protein
VLAASFVPWLVTSGNGRYVLPWLLLAGPVCIALAFRLPATRGVRLAVASALVALQSAAVMESAPWRAWAMSPWSKAPYFHVEVPADARDQPATYITMSAISYSLIAPQFHHHSRWMNLHYAPEPGGATPDARKTAAFLGKAQAGSLRLLVPTVPGATTAQGLPDDNMHAALDSRLLPFGLRLERSQRCRFLRSNTLADMGLGEKTLEQRAQSGFWLCGLVQVPGGDRPKAAPRRHDAVFRKIEAQCPRLFPAGGDHGTVAVPNGEMRTYLSQEIKAYVYDSGEVFYKYYRALNPVLVGTSADVLAGNAAVDCNKIQGRAGLPWKRGI